MARNVEHFELCTHIYGVIRAYYLVVRLDVDWMTTLTFASDLLGAWLIIN